MANNFCPNCGSPIKPGVKFCGKCGQKLIVSDEPKQIKTDINEPNPSANKMLQDPLSFNQPKKPNQRKYILGGIIGILVILVIVFGLKAMNNTSSDIAKTNNSSEATTTPSNDSANSPTSSIETISVTQNKPTISADLIPYINKKDQYDKDISNLASDINAHVSKYGDFKNDNGLVRRGAIISSNITKTKEALRNLDDNSLAKDKLLELLELETVRVESLNQGMISTKTGGDYTPGFKKGTEAAFKFDEANAAFNKLQN